MFFEILSLQKPYAKYNRSLHKVLVCENKGRPYPSMDIPWNSRNLLKRAWAQNSFDRPTIKEIYDELCPMIETVEQQVLPINERSLRKCQNCSFLTRPTTRLLVSMAVLIWREIIPPFLKIQLQLDFLCRQQ